VTPCRLYLDEDASDADLVFALRSRQVDVVTTIEARLKETSDEEQLRWAAKQGRVIYTFNARHFHALHGRWMREGVSHAGIIVGTQQRYSVGDQLRRLLKLRAALTSEDMVNRIEFLSAWGCTG
jgi:hypothetical protein